MLNPLVQDTAVNTKFSNVQRHNGLEAWRRIAEPINDDKELVRTDLLPFVTDPKPASYMDRVEAAIEE